MGALTQLGSVALAGGGVIDPGTAFAFVAAPWALSRVFSNPTLMKFLVQGTKGAKARNFKQFSRFMGQFGSALVAEGIITEENNSMVQTNIKTNQENLEKIFRNEIPDNTFFNYEETYNPAKEDSIPLELEESVTETVDIEPRKTNNIPLQNVTPSNLPLTGTGQSNYELAQALNLFNKGGLVSAKKNF